MSARVTSAEVLALLGTDAPSGVTNVDSYISIANTITNLLIDKVDTTLLQPIELYISAHLVAKKGITDTKTGESEDKYNFKAGFAFYLTEYGQMALAFSNGKLDSITGLEDRSISINYVYRG